MFFNKISLKYISWGLIDKMAALAQIMSWHRPEDKPLSEPKMVSLLTHICVTRPQQWVSHDQVWNFFTHIRQGYFIVAGADVPAEQPYGIWLNELFEYITKWYTTMRITSDQKRD